MSTVLWIVIVIVAVAAAVAITAVVIQRRHREELRHRFGPEYDRVVADRGDRSTAEKELTERARRRDSLDIRPLTEAERDRYAGEWEAVQTDFVEQPTQAAERADALIMDVMRTRGYPVEDFDARADLLTADHPAVVTRYREAEALRQEARANTGENTEVLRTALIRYRALFNELLGSVDAHGTDPRGHDDRTTDARAPGGGTNDERATGDADPALSTGAQRTV